MSFTVVINNRNRLTTTRNMVEHLLRLNARESIVILDNGSTYPPLLEWYRQVEGMVEVRMLGNEGHLALWATGMDRELGRYFAYTDSDIELDPEMPGNWAIQMINLIEKYEINKVGLAIRIDDIPDHYRYKNQVIRNEARWWLDEVAEGLYRADTDTTFAVYRNIHDNTYKSIRTARRGFKSRHVPFYLNLDDLPEEEGYYLDNHDHRKTTQYTKQHIDPENYKDI